MSQENKGIVLAVDDDPASLRMLFDHLRQAGFKVLVAEKGSSAMKRVERFRPDIVLLDVKLPDMDGFELCRRLKERHPEPDIPVMFLTMYTDIADKLRGLDLGAVDYMTKPFQPEEVVARVERHLALRNLQKRLQERNVQLEREIAERKRIEEKLVASEAELRALFAAMTDVILVFDRQGCCLKIAPTSPELLYKPADELLDKTLHEIFPKYQADVFLGAIHSSLDDQQTVSLEYELNIGKAELCFEGRVSPMSRDTVIYVARDITEHKQAEEQLEKARVEAENAQRVAEEARAAAEAANRAKSAFLAHMSHELRTPLNAILGYSQLMARDPRLTSTQQKHLETIARSGEHLLGLINDVLTMSKIEAGRTTLQKNAFDLYWQLEGLREMFQMRADKKGLTLSLDVAPDVPRYIYADEGKLRQVLMNLLSNAVMFTQQGSVTLRVKRKDVNRENVKRETEQTGETTITHHASRITFEVEDTGIGIGPEEMDALFDPFVQTASGQQSQEGTGLGLPISWQFVNLMGGELGVSSLVGQGTTFRMQIPVALAAKDGVEALDLQSRRRIIGVEPDQTAPDGGPFRLLVVEDKPTNSELLIDLLVPFGFEVHCAVNGAEGVKMWEKWQPHLIWMDMQLPVMDGYEATRQIKARAEATDCQAIVIAVTASAFEKDRKAILATGCDDFVRKPFREYEIFDVLHRHLGVRFIYETATPAPEMAANVSIEDLRAIVETLPATWVADLYQAAVILDADQMLSFIEVVRPQAPHLADTLVQWVRNFEYDKLIALVAPDVVPQA